MYRTRHWGAMYYLMYSCIRTERVHCKVHFSRVFWKNKFRVAINVFLHLPADCRALFLVAAAASFSASPSPYPRAAVVSPFLFFLSSSGRSLHDNGRIHHTGRRRKGTG